MFCIHLTPLLPLPPPAWLKSVAKVVHGDFSGVGSTLPGSEVFRWESDPAQTHLCGFSCSPKKACWVCLCPEACTHNTGVTARVELAPGLLSAFPVLGRMAVASAARCCWQIKSSGCSKPFQLGWLLRGGGCCPCLPLDAPRPTCRVGRWATEGCVPSASTLALPEEPGQPLCPSAVPGPRAVFLPRVPPGL